MVEDFGGGGALATPFVGQNMFERYAWTQKPPGSAVNRNPSKPYGRSAPWNGSPSRKNRAEPRRPLRRRYPSQTTVRQGAITELTVAGGPRVRIHLPPTGESTANLTPSIRAPIEPVAT